MSWTQLLKERDSIACTPIFCATNNGTQYTGTIDMSKFNRAQFFIMTGSLQGSSVAANMTESVNANGSPNTAITGSAITNISTNACMATLELNSTQMTKRYLMCTAVISGGTNANSTIAVVGVGTEGRYPPVNTANDVVSVTQRLAL